MIGRLQSPHIFRYGALGLVATCVLHLIVLGADAVSYVPLWFSGIFWTFDHWLPVIQQDRTLVLSGFSFWSTVAGPAVPLIILGLHWYSLDRRGIPVSRIGPVALLGWAAVMFALMPTGGFILLALAACIMAVAPPLGGWARRNEKG